MVARATRRGGVCVFFCAAFFSGNALADDCPPLTIVSSIDLTPAGDKDAELVPMQLQDKSYLMLLDTGAVVTEISSQVADELGLVRRQGGLKLYSVSGDYSDEVVQTSFKLGRVFAKKKDFMIMQNTLTHDDERIGGLLGPDILKYYDTEIDFGADKLNLLSPDHCEGKVIYWPATAVAVVPMRVLASGHIIVPVKLDGHTVMATLDTGASNSTLNQLEAESYGLTMGSTDTPRVGELAGRAANASIYRHTFKTLEFEGITMSNPIIDILPEQMGHLLKNTPGLGTRLADPKYDDEKPPMLLGMNVLKHLHLYIAYKEEKLYITPAEVPATPSGTNGAAAAGN